MKNNKLHTDKRAKAEKNYDLLKQIGIWGNIVPAVVLFHKRVNIARSFAIFALISLCLSVCALIRIIFYRRLPRKKKEHPNWLTNSAILRHPYTAAVYQVAVTLLSFYFGFVSNK